MQIVRQVNKSKEASLLGSSSYPGFNWLRKVTEERFKNCIKWLVEWSTGGGYQSSMQKATGVYDQAPQHKTKN